MRYTILICLFLIGCNNDIKFDKKQWLECENIEFTPRNLMLKDLITNYKLKGLTYKQLTSLIGPGENDFKKNNTAGTYIINYPVLVEYGTIDPIHDITLVLKLNGDSIVTDFHIDEWKEPWR